VHRIPELDTSDDESDDDSDDEIANLPAVPSQQIFGTTTGLKRQKSVRFADDTVVPKKNVLLRAWANMSKTLSTSKSKGVGN
jgi:hypothetical protein